MTQPNVVYHNRCSRCNKTWDSHLDRAECLTCRNEVQHQRPIDMPRKINPNSPRRIKPQPPLSELGRFFGGVVPTEQWSVISTEV